MQLQLFDDLFQHIVDQTSLYASQMPARSTHNYLEVPSIAAVFQQIASTIY